MATSSYLEDYTQKLNLVAIDSNRYLRHIRQLDKKVQIMQVQIQQEQKDFLEKEKLLKDKRIDQKTLDGLYESIVRKQKQCYGMGLEKVRVADQLYELIGETSQKLESDLAKLRDQLSKNTSISKEERIERQNALKNKKLKYDAKLMQKMERVQNTKEWLYDKNEPRYCYCGGISYGEMVQCDNVFCEKEWFHRTCVSQKVLPQEWLCSDCKKQREKLKATNLKNYL